MFNKIHFYIGVAILLVLAGPAAAQGPIGPEHSDPIWQATYWNNPTLSGPPAMHRIETHLDFDWGYGSPDAIINSDRFSARWTRYIDVTPGHYRFTVTADDGIRLWVDNKLIINQWQDQAPTTYTAESYLGPGHHLLKVEYYEQMGGAVARVSWMQTTPPTPSPSPGSVGYVTSRTLNIRSGPGLNYGIVSWTYKDEPLTLFGRNSASTWLKVKTRRGVEGWASAYYIYTDFPITDLPVLDESPTPPPTDPVGYVTVYRLNLRSGPGLYYGIKGRLYRGQPVVLLGRNNRATWLKVEDARTGFGGWVLARYIRSDISITNLPVLDEPPIPPPNPIGHVIIYTLNVRSGPDLSYGIKGRLYRGQPVVLLGRNNRATWLKVEDARTGFGGWVFANYIRSNVPVTSLPVLQ